MKVLSSELLKYRRTFMGKLIVFFPLFFAVYALVLSILMQNPLAEAQGNTAISWRTLLASVFNWWSFLFLPLGYALFAALVASQEKKAGNYQALLSRNVSPAALWVSKILGMAVYALLSSCVLILVVTMTGSIGAEGGAARRENIGGKFGLLAGFSSPDSTSALGGNQGRDFPQHGNGVRRDDTWGCCSAGYGLDHLPMELGDKTDVPGYWRTSKWNDAVRQRSVAFMHCHPSWYCGIFGCTGGIYALYHCLFYKKGAVSMKVLLSEWLRTKRTAIRWFIFGLPVFLAGCTVVYLKHAI